MTGKRELWSCVLMALTSNVMAVTGHFWFWVPAFACSAAVPVFYLCAYGELRQK